MILGSHGAGFSSLAFSDPGMVFIEIFQRGHFNHCFNRLAAINRLRYGFLVGEPVRGGGIQVDVGRLARLMESACGARAAV
jgi:hypothetical protein